MNRYTKWNIGWRALVIIVAYIFCICLMLISFYSLPKNLFLLNKQSLNLRQTLLLILDCFSVLAIYKFTPRALDFIIGNWGEKLVEEQLKILEPEFKVLSDLKPKKKFRNIDHVVIGPGGIFAIETKTVFSLMKLAEFKKHARQEAAIVSEVLKTRVGDFYVTPIVVFAGRYKNYPHIRQNDSTLAIGLQYINEEISKNKMPILDREQINKITNILKTYKQT